MFYLPTQNISSVTNPAFLPPPLFFSPTPSLQAPRRPSHRPPYRSSPTSCAPPPTPPPRAPEPQTYSLQTRLREEVDAPFRKVRQFVYLGAGMSAAVGGFVSALRIIASYAGVRGTQPLSETSVNVGVDVAAAAVCYTLWSAEQAAGARRLERLRRGARIAALGIEDAVTGERKRISGLRGEARVVIVCAGSEAMADVVKEVREIGDELKACRLAFVPFVTDGEQAVGFPKPVGVGDWKDWLDSEREMAGRGGVEDDNKVFVVVLKLNGKVISRSIGPPAWNAIKGMVQ